MNTLSRALTARIFPNPETYQALRNHWSRLINSERKHELTAAHHLLYLAMLGKDWRKAFTPVSNPRKLANGAFYDWRLFRALASLHMPVRQAELLNPFDGLVTLEMLNHIRRLVPVRTGYTFGTEQFSPGAYPFDAYANDDSAEIIHRKDRDEHA